MAEDFKFHMPIVAWEKAADENPLRIGGVVSTGGLDRQNEKVIQDGLDFSPFLSHGWFNDNHGQRTVDVLGYPTAATRIKKGDILPNGDVSTHDGWWAEGYLLNTAEGRRVYALARSLRGNSNRRLGFSIEGKVVKRDPADRSSIVAAEVRNVAVTHCPVNVDTSLNALAKALMAGGAVGNPGTSPGEGFPLRTESLDSDLYVTTYGGAKNDDDDDEEDEVLEALAADKEQGALSSLSKAAADSGRDPTTIDYVEHWADALADWVPKESPEASRVTKAEAAIIVANELPHLSSSDIDDLIESIPGGF